MFDTVKLNGAVQNSIETNKAIQNGMEQPNKTNVVRAINWAKYKIDLQKIQHDLTPYVYAISTNSTDDCCKYIVIRNDQIRMKTHFSRVINARKCLTQHNIFQFNQIK